MAAYSGHLSVSTSRPACRAVAGPAPARREQHGVDFGEIAAGAFFLAFSGLLLVLLTVLIQVSPAPRGPLP